MLHEQQRVLAIPKRQPSFVPYGRPNGIKELVVKASKYVDPILRPLFVHVASPHLAWYRRGEQHDIGQSNQASDKIYRVGSRNVLGYFE